MNPIIWLVILIVLLVIEVITSGPFDDLVCGRSAGGVYCCSPGGECCSPGGAVLGSFYHFADFYRPVVMRMLNKHKTATNAESLIGEQAIVTQTINNLMGRGEVLSTAGMDGQKPAG